MADRRESSESRIVLLGRDYPTYGDYHVRTLAGGSVSCAISVGSDPNTPALANKGDPGTPNEDALLAVDLGTMALLCVADAHFGCQASHELIEILAGRTSELPGTLAALERLVQDLTSDEAPTRSSSTLLVAVQDRRTQTGFGISFGDSSLVQVGSSGARTLNVRGGDFVDPRDPTSLRAENGYSFRFMTEPDQLLLAFTDGVDQCSYHAPHASIRLPHLMSLYRGTGPRPELYAKRLIELALRGVEENPGGQDNVALVVSSSESR